jgi:hypothetical protein
MKKATDIKHRILQAALFPILFFVFFLIMILLGQASYIPKGGKSINKIFVVEKPKIYDSLQNRL